MDTDHDMPLRQRRRRDEHIAETRLHRENGGRRVAVPYRVEQDGVLFHQVQDG